MKANQSQTKRVVVSGFFNPLHGGHLDMIEAAAAEGSHLIVVVNNDVQQLAKKNAIILNQDNRLRLIRALSFVDEAFIAVDQDSSVKESLRSIKNTYPDDELVFANGGDRDSGLVVPETAVCKELNIEMLYGVGGTAKADSSTRINQALGYKK